LRDFIGAGDPSTFRTNPDYKPDPNGPESWGAGTGAMGGGAGNDMLGVEVANGLVNGFGAQLTARTPEVLAGVDMMTQAVRNQLGVQSPSTVFAEIGGFLSEGLAQGISASQGLVADAAAAAGGAAVSASKVTADGILDVMAGLFKGSKAISAAQALVNVWTGATEALKLPFPGNLLAFGKVVATGMAAVNNIKGAQVGGGGGSSGGSAAAAAPTPMQVSLNTVGDGEFIRRSDLGGLFMDLQKAAGDRGYVIGVPA
jgi:hypothetical protein